MILLKAAIYIRVSTVDQVEGYSPDAQVNTIKHYIQSRHNLHFAWEEHIYKDLAVSGADPIDQRPEFTRMVRNIELSMWDEKAFDVVIVYKLDRFARKLSVLLDIVDIFEKLEIDFISTQESIDTSTPFGKAMLGILWVFSELERDMIQERTKMGIMEWLQTGSWYRTRRYGYLKNNKTWEVEVIEDEANIIKFIFEKLVYEQLSITDICNYLKREKIQNPSTAMWWYGGKKSKYWPYQRSDKTVRQLLSDQIYIGKYYYGKQKTEYVDKKRNIQKAIALPFEEWTLSPIQHEPIISDEIFFMTQEILSNGKIKAKGTESYLLSGLLKCDCCKWDKDNERVAWVGNSSHSIRSYRCRWRDKSRYGYVCPTTSLNMESLDQLVMKEIKWLISDPKWLEKALKKADTIERHETMLREEIARNQRDIHTINQRIKNNKELYTDGEIDKKTYESRLNETEIKLKKYKQIQVKLHNLFEEWLKVEHQKRVFELLKSITFNIDMLFEDKVRCKKFLNMLIEEIIVFSEKNNDIVIPGRKKDWDTYIATTIMIKFRLPQDFLNGLYGLPDDPKNDDTPDNNGINNTKVWWTMWNPTNQQKWRSVIKNPKTNNIFNNIFDFTKLPDIGIIQHNLISRPIKISVSVAEIFSLIKRLAIIL